MNISDEFEISYESYLKTINDNNLENSFCYGNSLSSPISNNDSYIEKVNQILNHYLTLLNKHSQIIPLSFINNLEINNDVYSHSAFLIIIFHCEKINECIKEKIYLKINLF